MQEKGRRGEDGVARIKMRGHEARTENRDKKK